MNIKGLKTSRKIIIYLNWGGMGLKIMPAQFCLKVVGSLNVKLLLV